MALLTVGVAECKVSNDPADVLITHALGSCIALIVFDPVARVVGLLHFMLPDSSIDRIKACERPCMFADTGVPLLLQQAAARGAIRSRMVIMAAGGASMLEPNGAFHVGLRNRLALDAIFQRAQIRLSAEDIGGSNSRALRVDVARGRVRIRRPEGGGVDRITNLGALRKDSLYKD